jgi:iron complex outermembrane receptor protein
MRKPTSKKVSRTAVAVAVANALAVNAASAADEAILDEVVVTATKRAQNLQSVPLAVTAISAAELENKQVTNILSIEKMIPGLTIRIAGNNPQAVVRGAGSAGTSDTAVPFYVNGMYLPHTGQALASFVDLERIEALRGPQGTLFGRNTFGGLVNFITKKPTMDGFDYGVALSAGEYSLQKLEGFVNIPLGEKVAFRLSAADETRDPFVKNVVNSKAGLKDSDYTYVRAQLQFDPTENLSINLSTTYWKDTGNGNLSWGYKVRGVPLSFDDPMEFDPITGYLDPRAGIAVGCADGDRAGGDSAAGNVCAGGPTIVDGTHTIDYEVTPWREGEDKSVFLNVNWEVKDHVVSFNAASFDYKYFSLNDVDFSPVESWADGEHVRSKNHQIDVTLSSMTDSPLQYTVGAYLYDSQSDDNRYAYLFSSLVESWTGYVGATPQTPMWGYWMTEGYGGTESKAVYGQADYAFTEKFTATAGVRYTEDDRLSVGSNILETPDWDNWPDVFPNQDQRRFDISNPTVPVWDYTGAVAESGVESHTDWRLGGSYQINDDVMFYGSMATAYIAGSIDSTSKKLLDPQENETIELGAKATLLDGALRLNASVYSAKYDGFSTTVFDIPVDGGPPLARQVFGGSIKSTGLEVEGYWDVSEEFGVDFNLSHDKSEYDRFDVASRTGTAGVDFVDPTGQGWWVMDGKDTPFSPDWTIGVGLNYVMDLGDRGTLTPRLDGYYNSGYQTAREHTFFTNQDAYTKLDVSVSWASSDGMLSAKLYVINATDEIISTMTDISPAPPFVAYSDYQAPRHWGLRFGYNF